MTETQVIFRLEKRLLKEFDETLKMSGFKTRNEWFRASIRSFLEDVERKKVLRKLRKLELKGLEETDIEGMVNQWRSEKK
ncbi:MAG: ribbon-helix-helix domain-containing protein [Candidatus Methanoperedens sp.]|nr:ribbon-helix-helix domain-containing protein [Candidatus Methanoperedens sp.]